MKRVVYSLIAIVVAQITIGAVAVVVGPALVLQSIQAAQAAPVSASAAGRTGCGAALDHPDAPRRRRVGRLVDGGRADEHDLARAPAGACRSGPVG